MRAQRSLTIHIKFLPLLAEKVYLVDWWKHLWTINSFTMDISWDSIIKYIPSHIIFLIGFYFFLIKFTNSNTFILITYLFQLPFDLNISNTTYSIYSYNYTTQYLQIVKINPCNNPYNLTEPLVPKDYKNYKKHTRYSGLLIREVYDFFSFK